MLIEEGKVRLDVPADRLVPELANRRVRRRLDANVDDTVPAKRPPIGLPAVEMRDSSAAAPPPGAATCPNCAPRTARESRRPRSRTPPSAPVPRVHPR
jgi:hypothetical protein